jgi:PAS domain S-box-containing protein
MRNHQRERKGLRTFWWLFLTATLLVVLPIFLFTLHQMGATWRIVTEEKTNQLVAISKSVAGEMDRTIERNKRKVEATAKLDRIVSYLADPNKVPQDRNMVALVTDIEAAGGYDSFFLLDDKGVVTVSRTGDLVGKDRSNRPYFSDSKGEALFCMAVSLLDGAPGLYISAPVYSASTRVGMVVAKISFGVFAGGLSDPHLLPAAKAFVTTPEGIVIASNDPGLMLKSLAPLKAETMASLLKNQQFAGKKIDSLGYDLLWDAMTKRGGDAWTRFHDPLSNSERMAAIAPLKDNRWTLVVAEDMAVIQPHVESHMRNIMYGGLVAAATLWLAVFVTSRVLAKPLGKMSKSIARIRAGERNLRLALSGPREIKEVCSEFNLMADQIASSYERCEREVKERTAELAKKISQLEVSEKRQKTIIENSPVGMMIVNRNKEIVEINTAALSLIGRKRGEVIGHICHQFICPAEEGKCPIFDNKETVDHSERVALNRNGEKVPVLKSVVRIEINDEECLLETFVDIVERKRAEAALRESEERYRSVVDNVSIGVALISPNMQVLALNRQMRAWFPGADMSQKPICYKAFNNPPGESICSYCPTHKTLQDGQIHESITATPANGQIINYRVVSSPLTDKDGKIVAAIEMVDDITERKRAEDEIMRAKEVAEAASLELAEKVGELEKFNRLAVGREMMMVELKRQINKLCEEYGKAPPYDASLLGEANGKK